MPTRTRLLTAGAAALALAVAGLSPATAGPTKHRHHQPDELTPVVDLMSPRGVDTLGKGRTLVTEGDGTFSLVVQKRHGDPKVYPLGTLGNSGIAPAIAAGRHGTVWLLTGAAGPPEEEGGPTAGPSALRYGEEPDTSQPATLYKWRRGWSAPKPVADIGAYQVTDPDPYDLEGHPEDSNPFGLAPLDDGSVLVADAAGNDLLRVWKSGYIKTVARFMPRLVEMDEGYPEEGFPPAGTPMMSEAVPTSVTVGQDGHWYVGELRGFPATKGTSQIWRVKPGSKGATCDPEEPWNHHCKRYADGLTSIIDLATWRGGVLALSLSKESWLAWELGMPGSEIGGLFYVHRWGHHIHELLEDQLPNPGGVDTSYKTIYLTAPIFGPGALWTVR